MWTDFPLVLAQDGEAPPPDLGPAPIITDPSTGQTPANAPNANNPPGPKSMFGPELFMILAVMLLFIFLMGGGRREKKKRAAMLAAMNKGDRVQTIGGIRGIVIERKDDEVLLKVDENANTRLRFAASAIQSVLEPRDSEESK